MSRKIQQSLFDLKPKRGRKPLKPFHHFGGIYLMNYNPSARRPMDAKKALHLVLRSSQATGPRSFKHVDYEAKVWEIISTHTENTGVRIYEYGNGGNHLHLLIRAKHRDDYNSFIRIISGLIARLVGKSQRGQPLKGKFWDSRPFTRIVSFNKREFRIAKAYLLRNTLEAIGWLPYFPRHKKLPTELRQWLMAAIPSG
jgi:REP element-mobilizing transposase RayT